VGPSFSRSYGGILPSSLTTVLPIALVFSTCPPVSVMGYGRRASCLAAFLGSMGWVTSPESGSVSRLDLDGARTYLVPGLHAYPRTTIAWAHLPFCVPASLASFEWVGSFPEGNSPLATRDRHGRGHSGTGISTGCASTTPIGLALAPDSPWAD
jgi:hypothetical protein